MTISSTVERITPERAESYLAANTTNRPVRNSCVKTLAAAINRGEWRLTHQGIAFDTRGTLVDGQHRLMAVVLSGQPVNMMVTRGVDPITFDSIDIGERRSLSDTLKTSTRAASVYAFANRIVFGGGKTSPQQAAIWERAIGSHTNNLLSITQQARRFVSSAGFLLAGVCAMLDGEPSEYVQDIYHKLILADIEGLPPVGRALLGHLMRNTQTGGTEMQRDALARGRIVFAIRNANLNRVLVRDASTAPDWARDLLRVAANIDPQPQTARLASRTAVNLRGATANDLGLVTTWRQQPATGRA